jgi:hypothetical protein
MQLLVIMKPDSDRKYFSILPWKPIDQSHGDRVLLILRAQYFEVMSCKLMLSSSFSSLYIKFKFD